MHVTQGAASGWVIISAEIGLEAPKVEPFQCN